MNKFVILLWAFDILNAPGFEFLDTTIPLNGLFWGFLWGWEILDMIIQYMRVYTEETISD